MHCYGHHQDRLYITACQRPPQQTTQTSDDNDEVEFALTEQYQRTMVQCVSMYIQVYFTTGPTKYIGYKYVIQID